jgi:hypothetical protein
MSEEDGGFEREAAQEGRATVTVEVDRPSPGFSARPLRAVSRKMRSERDTLLTIINLVGSHEAEKEGRGETESWICLGAAPRPSS